VKQMPAWRGSSVASLIPNVLPKAEAAACVGGAGCWCQEPSFSFAACNSGTIYCYTCHGRVTEWCTWCCNYCA
jgi:hypothetical protein